MITLTELAQQFLQSQLAKSPAGTLGIRIGLRDYGCSGYRYDVDYAKERLAEDQIFTFDALQIFIENKFMPALQGMEIDYVKQGVNKYAPEGVSSMLQFNNPNVVNACGCGESFKFKNANLE